MPAAPLAFKALGDLKGSLKKGTERDGKLLRKGQKRSKGQLASDAAKDARVRAHGSTVDKASLAAARGKRDPIGGGRLLRGGAK